MHGSHTRHKYKRKCMCELLLRKCKCNRKRQCKKDKNFHFLALAFAFAFHVCEPGQHKRKCKRKVKKTQVPCHHCSLKLKTRWHLPNFRREIGRDRLEADYENPENLLDIVCVEILA